MAYPHMFCISDLIEANVEQGAMRVVEGNKQLKKAISHKVRGHASDFMHLTLAEGFGLYLWKERPFGVSPTARCKDWVM